MVGKKGKPAKITDIVHTACCECSEAIYEDSRALQCERCVQETWKCIGCLGISEGLYDQLVNSDRNGLHWFCSACEEAVLEGHSLDKLNTRMDHIEQHLTKHMEGLEQKMSEKLASLEKALQSSATGSIKVVEERLKTIEKKPEVVEATQQRLESKLDQLRDSITVQGIQNSRDRAEEIEIDKRKKNVIIHGMGESTSVSSAERVDDDMALLAAMFQEANVSGVKVEEVVRLGKKPDNSHNPRPLKVTLDSEEGKVRLLRNAKNLRDKQEGGWSKVFIHQDLTPRQREARKPLVAELKERKANGEKDLLIYNGKVVKKRGAQPEVSTQEN